MYLGDYAEDGTLHFIWSSNDAVGASITRATDGTVSVYKDNGVTQSVAGITDTEDFDSLTGIHACTIDLSADAFYATGSNYSVVLSASTIDGQTVNAVLANFSIENRFDQIGAGGASLTDLGGMSTAMKAEVNAEADTALSDYDSPTRAEATSDKDAIITEVNANETKIDTIDTNVDAILVDTAEIGVAGAGLTTLSTFDSTTDTVDVGKISGSATAADTLESSVLTIVPGSAIAGTLTSTEMTTDLTEVTDDHYNGRFIIFKSGALENQATNITDYVGLNKKLVFTALTETPTAGDTFIII